MSQAATSTRRRWMMPLFVIAAAGGILLWSWRNEASKKSLIESYVRELCDALSTGPASEPWHRHVEGRVPEYLLPSLQRVCASYAGDPSAYHFQVTPGDALKDLQPHATHAVTVVVHGAPVLGLRVFLHNNDGRVELLGIFDPPSMRPP